MENAASGRSDDELARLRELNATQAGIIAELTTRVAELERRLGMNSSNSSKPPSSDGYAKKPSRAERRATARRQGKQPGAPGATLLQVADPDAVVVHMPERCGGCGAGLGGAEVVGVEARQVFDLPPVRLVVTEHRAERRRCGCGSSTAAAFPPGVRGPASYGPGVRAVAVYLCVHQHLPFDRAARLLADCLGAPVSTGSLVAMAAGCAEALGPALDAVRAGIAAAPVAHFDETGARVAGRLQWVHSASTPLLTAFHLHTHRGPEAMEAGGVLPRFAGTAVHDGWVPCRGYGSRHGLCNAHHLRELTALAETGTQPWAAEMAGLLVDLKRAVDRAVGSGRAALSPSTLARYRRRYGVVVAAGQAANPPPPRTGRRGRPKGTVASNLLHRLDVHRDDVLRFAADFAVPFDNNQAERDIRMVKLQQKISGCWRTVGGADTFLAVRSYVSTARKHGQPILETLRRAFDGDLWLPPQPAA